MTDRDHFAAAALTGLIASREWPIDSDEAAHYCYRVADEMLRERGDHIPDAGKMVETPKETQDGPASTPQVPRKPRTPQADRLTEWERHGSHRWGLGVASDLYDLECRVAVLEKANHDAAPAARASVESVAPQPTTRGDSDRTDKAAPRPSGGTGDTPDSPKPIKGGVSDRSKPINGPDPDSRVWETPVHTPAPHATPGDGSVPREGTQEPVAWGVANGKGLLATSISRIDAVDMQSYYACDTAVVPLYRQAPDFAPPPPDNAAKAPDNAEPVAWAVDVSGMLQVVLLGGESYARFEAKGIRRDGGDGTVVPLYRRPQPTLTDAEREAVERSAAAWEADARMGLSDGGVAATLRGLLGRLGGGR